MKKNLFTIFMLCCLFYFSLSKDIFSQGFNSITTSDGVNVVAVGNSGKVYRSGNGGLTYSSSIIGVQNLNSVTSFENDVWFAGQNGNIYKTLKISSPINTYNVGSSMTLNSVEFLNANIGFVCGDGGAVYKSENAGVNWTISNSGITSIKLNSISFRDIDNGVVVGNNGAVYVTNNGGASWVMQSSGSSHNLLKVKYFDDVLVAVGEYGTLLKNDGNGWNSISTRVNSDITGVTGTNFNDVHICGGGGFIRNNRNQSNNFFNFEINPMLANLVDIFYYNTNIGFAVSSLNNIIIRTTNGGLSWELPQGANVSFNWISKTPGGSGIGNNLCKHPTDRNSVFVVYGNQVYVSRDKGESWSLIRTITIGTRAHSFYVSPVDTNVWMAAMESSPDKVVRSTDYGLTWNTILSYNFSAYGQPLEMDQNNPNIYYYAPDGPTTGFFKSTNNGASFASVSNNNPFTSPCDIIVMWDSSNVLFVGDDGADIFKSSNGGVNWILVKPGSSSEIPSMCNSVFDKSLCYATTWGGSQVFRTVNHGDNWNLVSVNSHSGWGSDLCHEDPTVVLTGSYGQHAFLTTNGGANFFNVDSLLGGAGAGIMVPERGYFLNMQAGTLFKLNINYSYIPVLNNIDVQVISVGATGTQIYQTPTLNPFGTVRNNNGVSSATFNVTKTIIPGGYISTKTVTNLAPNSSTNVIFDPWTFNAGTTYSVKDSVYMIDDTSPGNDILSGTLTPYLGQSNNSLSEGFTTFPPTNWSFEFTGTNYWVTSNVSSYGIGTGSSKYNFWNAPAGTVQSMLTPTFTPTLQGDSLEYDYAYAPYSGSTDSLIIETSTNSGSSYTTLVRLYGSVGASGIYALNTIATSSGQFTPTANQWLTRKWSLPGGTNKIKFRAVSAFGNNLYLDSIRVKGSNIFTQVNIRVSPEGMFNGSTLNLRDTITAYLRSTSPPFVKIDSAKSVIDSLTLAAACVFMNSPTGRYYIQVNHRNTIETWSKSGGEKITRGITFTYDFTSSQSQSFGNNSRLVGEKWCLFSGDVNQDGIVDASDLALSDNDAFNSVKGYVTTDVNGDYFVDAADLSIIDNNAYSSITKITPEVANASAVEKKLFSKDKID